MEFSNTMRTNYLAQKPPYAGGGGGLDCVPGNQPAAVGWCHGGELQTVKAGSCSLLAPAQQPSTGPLGQPCFLSALLPCQSPLQVPVFCCARADVMYHSTIAHYHKVWCESHHQHLSGLAIILHNHTSTCKAYSLTMQMHVLFVHTSIEGVLAKSPCAKSDSIPPSGGHCPCRLHNTACRAVSVPLSAW